MVVYKLGIVLLTTATKEIQFNSYPWYKSFTFVQRLPWVLLLDQISCCNAADHQGTGADVPPDERLPIMCHNGGSILWLVRPGGEVRHVDALINTCTQRQTNTHTPTHTVPPVKHSRVFVPCSIADTFRTLQCLCCISCCPCSRKELKLFLCLMQRRQSVQFTLIRLSES